jgi:hypothetical protein
MTFFNQRYRKDKIQRMLLPKLAREMIPPLRARDLRNRMKKR